MKSSTTLVSKKMQIRTIMRYHFTPTRMTGEALETYRKRMSCLASEQGLEGQPPFSLYWALLSCSLQVGTIFPMLSTPPLWKNLNVHWHGELCLLHPGDSLGLSSTKLTLCLRLFQWWTASPSPHCRLSWVSLRDLRATAGQWLASMGSVPFAEWP